MQYIFRPFTPDDAHTIATWCYDGVYSFYNAGPDDADSYLTPQYHYHTIFDAADKLIGYFCLGEDATVLGGTYDDSAVDLGMGLRPDLTGKGLGAAVTAAVMDYVRDNFAPPAFRITVAAFNQRALQMCAKVGFQPIALFISSSAEPHEFVVLSREASREPK